MACAWTLTSTKIELFLSDVTCELLFLELKTSSTQVAGVCWLQKLRCSDMMSVCWMCPVVAEKRHRRHKDLFKRERKMIPKPKKLKTKYRKFEETQKHASKM